MSDIYGVIADEAWFDRSPGRDEDGPLDVMEVEGLRFARVARPAGEADEQREWSQGALPPSFGHDLHVFGPECGGRQDSFEF